MDKETLLRELAAMVKEKRYGHSLRCAETSVRLAGLYGADPDKAWIAGLTHDIARGQDPRTVRQWARLDKGGLSAYEEQYPNVLHSYASAWYLRHSLGIEDESILNAVRFHTTGSPGMDLLAKVVFAADYLEPGREHLDRKAIEEYLRLSIDSLVLTILDATREYLRKKNIPLSPESEELYQALTKRYNTDSYER